MLVRRIGTRLALLLLVVAPASLTGCAPFTGALTPAEPPARESAAAACAQLEMAANAARLDAAGAGLPTDSVGGAMAASMAQSRAAIAQSEYQSCLASH